MAESTATVAPTISRLSGGNGVTLFADATQEGFVVGANTPAKFTGDIYIEDSELEALWDELTATS